MMSTPTCKERLPKHLESRLEDFRLWAEARDVVDAGLDEEHDRVTSGVFSAFGTTFDRYLDEDSVNEVQGEYPLGVSVHTVVRVELSVGGPQDYFELHYTEGEFRPHRITYHFLDWFDGATKTLEGDEFDTAEAFLETFSEMARNNA